MLVSKANHTLIFTDGSKSGDLVGCSYFVNDRQVMCRLHAVSSVYTAELYAIYRALDFIHLELNSPCVILTDSLSSLKSMEAFEPNHPLVQGIRLLLRSLNSRQISVLFLWIPGHVGIRGNELADVAAKSAALRPAVDVRIAFDTDVKAYFKPLLCHNWQNEWINVARNKLRAVKGDVQPWVSSCRNNRREETAITRLRIGHCWWTHCCLLRQEEPPICETCDTALTVSHILLDCVQFEDARDRSGLSWDLSVALGDNKTLMDRLILFLNCAGIMPYI